MTPTKERALAALLVHSSKAEAAAAAGISARTLRSYFQDSEFCERYRQAFTSLLEDSTRAAQRAITPALKTLEEIMADTGQPGSVRVSASKALMEHAEKLTEQIDVITRMTELEKAVAEIEGGVKK